MAGDISRETLWEELKRRGVLSNEFDPGQEAARLESEVPWGIPDEQEDELEEAT